MPARSTTGTIIAPVATGSIELGRLSLSGSLADVRKGTAAAEYARAGYSGASDCMERKRNTIFDAWFDGSYDEFNYTGAQGHFGLFKIGFDVKLGPGILIGALAQYDMTGDKSQASGYLVKGTGWLAGPYAEIKLGSSLKRRSPASPISSTTNSPCRRKSACSKRAS